ncbi:MAG: methyltransferase domain-containing protein [Polyangiaceae bacterium]|nr:methyltransferase domain-containing protein [Polyangiaceae bacterium]
MTTQPDLGWLEALLEAQYGFAPTVDLRQRLSSSWNRHGQLPNAVDSRMNRLRQLAESLVIGETYFFREPAQIEYLVRHLLLDGSSKNINLESIRILSAGCASGEEAYSLAIAIDALGEAISSRVSIVGVDVSAAAIRKARSATYSAWSLRATPPNVREACFHRRGDMYELDKRFRGRVHFEERNLFEVDNDFWAPGAFDVIFCRNVGIYLSPRAWADLIARFSHVLTPGGHLFLGHSETLRGIPHDFDLVHAGNVFYYRRQNADRSVERRPPPDLPLQRNDQPARRNTPTGMTAINERTVVSESTAHGRPSSTSRRDTGLPRLHAREGERHLVMERHRILSLIEMERFDEAFVALGEMPADPRIRLYGAVVAMARGSFEEIESVCHALLAAGHCQPEAHCLLGACREHQRAFDSAERHYREAARIDPRFGIAHLRLGLLLHRTGDADGGQSALEEAERRLEHEDPERIALFGGGFSRNALLGLCRGRMMARKV